MPANRVWLENPADGTECCGGFDGSENDDWTAIKLETFDGLIFTPRYGPDRLPTIWDPGQWGGRIPRDQIRAAWDELNTRYRLRRVYCDPGFRDESSWDSEIESWATSYGEDVFIPWVMAGSMRIGAVYAAMRRFESDLEHGLISQDGCPITEIHMGNVRKLARSGDRYIPGKPSQTQKIDAAVTSLLAHEAACDMRAAGWQKVDTRVFHFRR